MISISIDNYFPINYLSFNIDNTIFYFSRTILEFPQDLPEHIFSHQKKVFHNHKHNYFCSISSKMYSIHINMKGKNYYNKYSQLTHTTDGSGWDVMNVSRFLDASANFSRCMGSQFFSE